MKNEWRIISLTDHLLITSALCLLSFKMLCSLWWMMICYLLLLRRLSQTVKCLFVLFLPIEASGFWWIKALARRPEERADQQRGQVLLTSGCSTPTYPPPTSHLPEPIKRSASGHLGAITADKKSINPARLASPANTQSVSSQTTRCDSRWVYQHKSDLRRYWRMQRD